MIQDALRVSIEDLNTAKLIVNQGAPAVFKHNNAMCEPATHFKWASNILERAKCLGVKPAEISVGEPGFRLAEVSG